MTEPLKILIVEDNSSDAEMVQYVLKKENLSFQSCIAMNREQYVQCLDQFMPDIILSDNSLPQFSATEALEINYQKSLYIPFILVTGTVSEEFAAGIIKLGADDYILKDRLTRLPSAIDNALKQRRAEREKREAIQKLKMSEEYLSTIFENTSEGFILTDRDCIIKAYNENGKNFIFFNTYNEVAVGLNLFDLINPLRVEFAREKISKTLNGEKIEYTHFYHKKKGAPIWLNFSITPVRKNDVIDGICITTRDITELKRSEEMQRAMEREILDQKVQQQKQITRAMIRAQEKERNYIGQELHDNVNQILAGTKMYLDKAGKNDEKLEALIKYPVELIDLCMDEIRLLSRKLVTPVKDINLQELVQSLLAILDKNLKIKTSFVYDISISIEDELKLNIYRILQEQVNNIIKHAQSQHVVISIKESDKSISIVIIDDGQGFDVNQKRKGVGISNMINRVESFNGEVLMESAPGEGCAIRIIIPY